MISLPLVVILVLVQLGLLAHALVEEPTGSLDIHRGPTVLKFQRNANNNNTSLGFDPHSFLWRDEMKSKTVTTLESMGRVQADAEMLQQLVCETKCQEYIVVSDNNINGHEHLSKSIMDSKIVAFHLEWNGVNVQLKCAMHSLEEEEKDYEASNCANLDLDRLKTVRYHFVVDQEGNLLGMSISGTVPKAVQITPATIFTQHSRVKQLLPSAGVAVASGVSWNVTIPDDPELGLVQGLATLQGYMDDIDGNDCAVIQAYCTWKMEPEHILVRVLGQAENNGRMTNITIHRNRLDARFYYDFQTQVSRWSSITVETQVETTIQFQANALSSQMKIGKEMTTTMTRRELVVDDDDDDDDESCAVEEE